jgi:flagellar transcriptional activator FlhC
MLRFLDSRLLDIAHCTRCNGSFIVHALDLQAHYVCGLCAPPSRAGKTVQLRPRAVAALPA